MRLNVLKRLIETNIIYFSTEASLANLRKKQAKNPQKKVNVSRSLLTNYLFAGVLYLFLFGGPAFLAPLEQMPGQFSNSISFFLVFVFFQGFLTFYNVFYESKDLDAYVPYAFKESEVMLAKGIAVLFPILMGLFPILSYVLALNVKSGQPFWIAIPVFLISVALLFSSLAGLMIVCVHFLTKASMFRKYKKIISTALMVISYTVAIGAIIVMNTAVNRTALEHIDTGKIVDQVVYFPPVQVFHSLAVAPFSMNSLLGLLGWLAVTALLFAIIRHKVVPQFYESAREVSDIKQFKARKTGMSIQGKNGLKNFVWRYHVGLVGQGTVFLQSVLVSAILPYLMFLGILIGYLETGSGSLNVQAQYLMPYLIGTALIATINYGGMNLTTIGISLERENFDYLKVLPMNMADYLKLKFWILFVIQSILPLLLFIGLSIFLGIPFYLLLILVAFWILVSMAWSSWAFYRDYKHLVTNWSNVTELFNRENSLVRGLLGVVLILLGAGLTVLSAILVHVLPELTGVILGLALFVLLGLIAFFVHRHFLIKLRKAVLLD